MDFLRAVQEFLRIEHMNTTEGVTETDCAVSTLTVVTTASKTTLMISSPLAASQIRTVRSQDAVT